MIVAVDGRKALTVAQLRKATSALEPGDDVRLRLRRDGKIARANRQAPWPRRTTRSAPIIGISVAQDAKIELPLDVEHRPRQRRRPVGGAPVRARRSSRSSGNDVDRGYRVAATGRDRARRHRRPGRRAQAEDATACRSSGADVFLVPAGENAATARRYAGGLRMIPVESFQQALRVLQTLPPEIAILQGFCLEGRQPQIAGISRREGVAATAGRSHNARCPSGDQAGEQRGHEQTRHCDLRGLLFPPGGPLRPSGEHSCPTFRAATAAGSRPRAAAPRPPTPLPQVAHAPAHKIAA